MFRVSVLTATRMGMKMSREVLIASQDPKIMDEVENGTVEQQLLLYLKNKLIEKIEMRSDY